MFPRTSRGRTPQGRTHHGRAITATLAAVALTAACSTTTGGETEQTLRFAPGNFPVALDVQRYPAEVGVQTVMQNVLEPLVNFTDGEAEPALAESWDNPDEVTWTFTLREVEFSDGANFTAEDAKASLDRLIELDGPLATLFAPVTDITADDERTLTIETSEPLGTLLNSLSLVFIGTADGVDDDAYWRAPIGTGPFTVAEYVADDSITLERNDSYWGEVATLDEVEIVNIPEVSAKITALQTGEIHAMTDIPPDQVASVEDEDGITYSTEDSFQYLVNWFNHNNSALDDERVRQALTHAVDSQSIIADLWGEESATTALAPTPQAVFGSPELAAYAYDPDLAEDLLAEAGYEDGLTLEMIWPNDAAANVTSLAQAYASQWSDVGVTVNLHELERAQWLERFESMDWDMSLFDNVTSTGDADYTLNRLYTCVADRMGYCDEDLDTLLDDARASLDQDEREDLYREASELLWDGAVSMWPVELVNSAAVRDEVDGFTVEQNGRTDFSTISISEE